MECNSACREEAAKTHLFHLSLASKPRGVGAELWAATASSTATLASHYVGTDKKTFETNMPRKSR